MKKLHIPVRAAHVPIIVVCAVFFAAWTVMAAMTPIVEADEARYVQVAREMIAGGNWLALKLHGEAYDQKPPIPFWMIGLALKATGGELGEWAVRMPSIILATLTVWVCGLIGVRRLGAEAGICAALMLGSMVQFLGDAPRVELNVPLCFWTTLSVAFWLTRRKDHRLSQWRAVGLWGALAVAILTKGPLALLVVASVVIGDALETGGLRRLRLLRPALGGFGLLGVLAGYLAALALANGPGFVQGMLEDALVRRVMEGDHEAPFYFYLVKLPTSIILPWSPVLAGLVWHAWRCRGTRAFAGGMAFVGWVIVPLAILSIAHGKRESYAVPLLPGFGLLFAWFLFSRTPAVEESRSVLLASMGKLRGLLPARRTCVSLVAAVTVMASVVLEATAGRASANEESPERFGAVLTEFVGNHSTSSTIGAFEKADGCEYYTYSAVDVRELEITKPEQVDLGDWPDVLAGRKSDWRKFADTAILNGYVPVLSSEAAGERVQVWARRAKPGETPRVAVDVLQDQ